MSEADLQPLITWLNNHPSWIVFCVFLISFIESLALAGIIVPGVLLLFLVAALAGSLSISLMTLLFAGFIGAVLGDGISFYLGRYFKDSLPTVWPFKRHPELLNKGERFFQKHGGKSVVLGRFIGPVRPVIPIVVGMLGMSPARFAFFNISSAVAWAPFYILPGYLTGKASNWLAPDHFYEVMIGTTLVLITVGILFRFLSVNLQEQSQLTRALITSEKNNALTRTLAFITGQDLAQQKQNELPVASLALLLISTALFSVWTLLVLQSNSLIPVNALINDFFIALKQDSNTLKLALEYCAVGLTLLGDEAFLYISFTVVVIYLLSIRHYHGAVMLVIAGLATAVLTHTLKDLWMIERPSAVLMLPDSFAYPSGHSSGATVFYGLIAAFIAQAMAPLKRWKCYLSFFVPMLMIALSRLMLNLHWLSDIIGGVLLGLMICGGARLLYARYQARDESRTATHARKGLIIAITAWCLSALVYQLVMFEETLAAFQLAHHL